MSSDEFEFVPLAPAPGSDTAPGAKPDVFTQLMEGTTEEAPPVELDDDDSATLEQAWQKLVSLRRRRDELKEQASDASDAYEAQRGRMASLMQKQGTTQFRGADGGSCSVSDVYTTAIEDEDKWMTWVKESHPELLSVHSQRRTSFIRREYRDKGIPIDDPSFPPGLKAGTQPTLSVRGIRPASEAQGAKTDE